MAAWQKPGVSDEWYTPKYIFDALGATFDLDVAAAKSGGHVPCKARITEHSLRKEWPGFIWMNPPFGGRNEILAWMVKFMARSGLDGIGLCPDRTSAPWFQQTIINADLVLFVSPKIKFERPDGTTPKSPGDGTVLYSTGPKGRYHLLRGASLGMVMEPRIF